MKTELDELFASPEIARAQIGEYIDVFYNYHRLHSSLGDVSPTEFEVMFHNAACAA